MRESQMVLAAEESLVAAHSTAVSQLAAMLPTEQRMLDAVGGSGGTGDVDDYVRQLRDMVAQRRQQLASLEGALAQYDQSCASEDTARQNVKAPVSLPWA